MKKLVLGMFTLVSVVVFGQRVQKGDIQLNGGIGFTSGWGVPVYVGLDYGVHKDITVGGQATYASHSENLYKSNWFGIAANANYHFNSVLDIPNNWDLYAGLSLAYNNFSYTYTYTNYVYGDAKSSGVGFAGQVGARYYFNDHFGLNAEFGGGNIASGGKIGVSYKF